MQCHIPPDFRGARQSFFNPQYAHRPLYSSVRKILSFDRVSSINSLYDMEPGAAEGRKSLQYQTGLVILLLKIQLPTLPQLAQIPKLSIGWFPLRYMLYPKKYKSILHRLLISIYQLQDICHRGFFTFLLIFDINTKFSMSLYINLI